jgi:ATP-dependent phosphoenolpyruvate carboxykinase
MVIDISLLALLSLSTLGNIIQGYYLGRASSTRPISAPVELSSLDNSNTEAQVITATVPAKAKKPLQSSFTPRKTWAQQKAAYETAHNTRGKFAQAITQTILGDSNVTTNR